MTAGPADASAPEREACLDDDELARILDSPRGAIDAAMAHASWCDACRSLLAMMARLRAAEREAELTVPPQHDDGCTEPPDGPTLAQALEPGRQVGRFVLERAVGEGGMGVVFCASDTTLQRRVAIKFLHLREADPKGDAKRRLLREAQAMARVVHPNVVRVYEASTSEELAYIVMEFVDGMDLRHWLRAEPRTWADVTRAYAAAGRGLAAAHAHGLVHRDFKPHNVLMARDGRVLVTDFGLARSVDAPHVEMPQAVGTPRYMAPEQQDRSEVGPAADQFAFCTALGEALIEPRELVAPPALREILARGTERRPEARFADMDTLVRELERLVDAPLRRRRVALGVLALVAVGAVAFGIGTSVHEDACAAPEEGDFAGIWDAARRDAIETVLATPSAGEATWTKVSELVDDYTARWSTLRHEACEATVVRSEVSEAVLDRRMACLGRGRLAVGAMVDLLATADGEAVEHALELALALPPIDRCNAIVEPDAGPPRPEGTNDRIAAAERELATVHALIIAGESADASRRLAALRTEAEDIGWAPLVADVLVAAAHVEGDFDGEAACKSSQLAYRAAITAGSDATAYEAALGAAMRHAWMGRLDEAELFAGLAESHVQRLGAEPDPGKLALVRSGLERRRGDMQAALDLLESARVTMAADPGRMHELVGVLGDIGGTLHEMGRLDEAFAATERAIEVSTEAFGADHHKTLGLRANRALAAHNRGAFHDAETELRAVLALQERMQLPVPRTVTLTMLASTLRAQGRHADALPLDEEALRVRRETLGGEHPLVAESLSKVASDAIGVGRTELAIAKLQEAIAIALHHPYEQPLLDFAAELAYAHQSAGDLPAALAAIERALPVRESLTTPERRALRFDYRHGHILVALGRHEEAAEWLRSALAIIEPIGADHRTEAFVRYQLGRALWELGDTAEGRVEVERAHTLLDMNDDRDNDTWPEIEQWLAAHVR